MPGQRGARKKAANPGAARSADGGYSQPVRPIPSSGPGSTIGDRQASVALQQGAPMAAGGPATAPAPVQGGAPAGPPPQGPAAPDPFGPSQRPNEPLTAGAALGPGSAPPDPNESTAAFLLELYKEHEDDAIRGVLEELQSGMSH